MFNEKMSNVNVNLEKYQMGRFRNYVKWECEIRNVKCIYVKCELCQKGHIHSLEGSNLPSTIYTCRVMDISKINNYLSISSSKGKCVVYNLCNICFMNNVEFPI